MRGGKKAKDLHRNFRGDIPALETLLSQALEGSEVIILPLFVERKKTRLESRVAAR